MTATAAPMTKSIFSNEKIAPTTHQNTITATIAPTTQSTRLGRMRGGRSTSMAPRYERPQVAAGVPVPCR